MSASGDRRRLTPAWLAGLRLAGLILSAGSVGAQAPDPGTTVVQELVVTANRPGPAWWTVSKGDSTVWMLGVPNAFPRKVTWDQSGLIRRLTLSRALILPPAGTAGLGDIWGLLSARATMTARVPLEQRAPPEVTARFLAAAQSLGKSPSTYDRDNGVLAGMSMSLDYRQKLGVDFRQPELDIEREAHRHHVPVTHAASYKILPIIRASVKEVTPAIEWTCIDAAAAEIAGGPARTLGSAQAWARGDTRGLLNVGRGFEACAESVPAGADFWRRATSDEVAIIEKALQTPGHVIAVVDLRSLVAEGGVLDRLRHAGYEVRGD